MNYTENYQLNQWEQSDRILMEDFNSDNQKIEAALEELETTKTRLVYGTYTGDGQATRVVNLGFTPLWILSFYSNGQTGYQGLSYGGLAFQDRPVQHGTGTSLEIVDGGIRVGYDFPTSLNTNVNGYVYCYIACIA